MRARQSTCSFGDLHDQDFAVVRHRRRILVSFLAAPAQAGVRTWVSGGRRHNQRSRTAPCKTFAVATSKTALNGESTASIPAASAPITK
jgi:hypothetical protein